MNSKIRSRSSIISSRNNNHDISIASGDDSSRKCQQYNGYHNNNNSSKQRPRCYHGGRLFNNIGIHWTTTFHRLQWQFYKYVKKRKHHASVLNIFMIASALIFTGTKLFHSGLFSFVSSTQQQKQQHPQVSSLLQQLQPTSAYKKRVIGMFSSSPKRTKVVERPLYTTDPPIFLSIFGTTPRGVDLFHPMPDALISSPQPDYGQLQINFLQQGERRIIHPDPKDLHGHVWTQDEYDDESWDEYYAFDDDYHRNLPFKDTNKTCRRVAFHRNYFPNCNLFHEIEIMKGTNRYLGSGAYREAYLQHEPFDPQLVVKVQRFRKNPFTYDRYEFIRMDALVMERLTASPRIADIYGHCATSVYSEFLPDEAEERIIPGDGDGSDLNDKEDVDPKNNFTISEKLDLALQMAESIADLHGYKYGVIVHDDIQLAQFLFAPDGRLKLNDFNRAEAMLFDEEDGSYCRYQNGKGAGDYRSPEEYKDGWLNEKIDIWSFGNNIYALITGLWVFYDEEKTKVKQKKLIDGEIAYLDPRYKGRNYILDRLIELMYRCWVYEPDDRIDIFESVSFLRETLEEAKRRQIYDGRF